MGDFVEELLVRLGIDVDRQSFSSALRTMADIGVAASAVSAAVGAMAVSFANAGRDITTLAQIANTSTEVLQRNAAAARTVGVETEELAQAYKDISDRVGDFLTTGGGPMVDFFEQVAPKVGVTAEQFRNLTGPDALQLYVSSLEAANLSQNEMTFFLESIAGDLTKLQPLLANGGAEMKRLGDAAAATGAIMDDEAIRTAKELGGEMSLANTTIQGLRNTIAKELAPTLINIIKSFREFVAENRELISIGIVRLFDAARFALQALSAAVVVFLSYKLGVGVLAIASGVRTLTAALSTARIAMLLLNASALLIPVLIGSAVAGAVVAFEDLMVWLDDGNSAIGLLLERMPALNGFFEALRLHATNLKDLFNAVWELLTGDWETAGALFSGIVARWREALIGFFSWVGSKVQSVFGGIGEFFGLTGENAGALGTGAQGGIIGGVPAGSTTTRTTIVNQTDARVINIDGADVGMVKRVLRQDNAYAAKAIDTGYEY